MCQWLYWLLWPRPRLTTLWSVLAELHSKVFPITTTVQLGIQLNKKSAWINLHALTSTTAMVLVLATRPHILAQISMAVLCLAMQWVMPTQTLCWVFHWPISVWPTSATSYLTIIFTKTPFNIPWTALVKLCHWAQVLCVNTACVVSSRTK